MKLRLVLPSIMIATLSVACGKSDGDKKDGGGSSPELALSPFEQLTADWSGIYRSLKDGKPSGDALGATAKFSADKSFAISLDEDTSARVEGEWSEFQGKTLILRIHGSTISGVGSAGKVVEPTYEITGSSLRIATETFELKLSKKSSPDSPQSPGGAQRFFVASWNCDDGLGRQSKIAIADDNSFRLSSLRSGERLFAAKGNVSEVSQDAVRLAPESSSDPLPNGSFFELHQAGLNADLILFRPDQQTLKLGRCVK